MWITAFAVSNAMAIGFTVAAIVIEVSGVACPVSEIVEFVA